MKKFKLIGVLFAAIITTLSLGVGSLSAFALQAQPEDPVQAEISLDQDFDGTSVLVTMTEEASEVNREYEPSYFGDVAISSIEDLTRMTGDVQDKKYFDESKFKQILKINLPIDSKANVIAAIDKLEETEGVLCASPNYYDNFARIPNDTDFLNLWGLNREQGINAVDAWDITTGSRNVQVGVIDTGIADHPDLNANVEEGWDFVNNNNITDDDPTGHGTHVAGIIGACGNNVTGVVGVNWQVSLVPLQVAIWDSEDSEWIMSGSGTISAITWAKDNDIPILNYSAGTYEPWGAVKNALESYTGLFVCSAGNGILNESTNVNEGVDTDVTPHYPSEYSDESNPAYSGVSDRVISVGAIAQSGQRALFSNYGTDTVSIFAPGVSILSTVPDEIDSTGYALFSGTSMAAPHVAGVAALILSAEPTLTASQIKDIILNTADSITINVPNGTQNVRKLNAFEALSYIAPVYNLFAGGTGTSQNPFLISNAEQFNNMRYAYTSVHMPGQPDQDQIAYAFRLTNNIVLPGDWTPLPYDFTGEFDGDGHYISYNMNLTQADINESTYQGLFGFVSNAGEIYDLELMNCKITSDTNTELSAASGANIGILAGSVYEAGGISNITITNPEITTRVSGAHIGALAGTLFQTSVKNCIVREQNGTASITNNAHCYMGGMIGSGDLGGFNGGSVKIALTNTSFNEDTDTMGKIAGNGGDTVPGGMTADVTMDKGGSCVAAGTLITLADGTQKAVEELTGNEMLLVWNLKTGTFDAAPILFIDSEPIAMYSVINLYFSDGTQVKVVSEHGFWDYNLNEYVYLDQDAAQYIGHWFNKLSTDASGNRVSATVQLVNVVIQNEYTTAWSPVTYSHLCYYVNGMLSMPGGIEGMFNIFEVDAESMKYDEAQMQADIAQYGLFTYEEFAELFPISEAVFEAFNGQYLKIAMGKGLIDADELQNLIERYAEFLSEIE